MSDPSPNRLKAFIHEIHRRSLWQVLGIYVLASWGVLSVVDTLAGALGLPDWFPSFALGWLVVGLPIVLATAFVQVREPPEPSAADGVAGDGRPSDTPPASPSGLGALLTWRNAILGGAGSFSLLLGVGVGWVVFGSGIVEGSASSEQSVAVLPFEDLSPDGDQRFFVEGLSEEIINVLTRIPGLFVPARTSTFMLAEQGADIGTVASTLGVAHVLEGSVRKSGEQVRISANLIHAESGVSLWSETFTRELTDVFAIQDEIAQAITGELQVTIAGQDEVPLVAEATGSTEAYEAYLRGRFLWNQRTFASITNAIDFFEQAIALDPSYAAAYSGLADSYHLVDGYRPTVEGIAYRENFTKGLEAARTAVRIAPELAMTRASLGWAYFLAGEWDLFEEEFRTAIDLNPGYAQARHWYGYSLWATGGAEEAVGEIETAIRLDPVSRVFSRGLSRTLWSAGRREAAVSQAAETTALAPSWAPGWFNLAWMRLALGRDGEGLAAWLEYSSLLGDDGGAATATWEAAIRHRETGEPQEIPLQDGNPQQLVWIYARTGNVERALEHVRGMVEGGALGWTARVHVLYARELLGQEPEYQALMARAGITW